MTGMKEGAGDDPFADDDTGTDDEPSVSSDRDAAERDPIRSDAPVTDTSTATQPAASETADDEPEYPYMLTRDTVKEDRTNEAVFFLRDEYAAHEGEIHDAVEELLDDDVYLTDLREAMVATADPEAIAEQLREWGHSVS